MTETKSVLTSVSNLLGMAVVDAAGKSCGRVHEFAVNLEQDSGHVHAFVLSKRVAGKESLFLGVDQVEMPGAEDKVLKTLAAPTKTLDVDAYLLLGWDLLDQQIIDVHGHKVVRVNDVNLVWEPGTDGTAQGCGLRK